MVNEKNVTKLPVKFFLMLFPAFWVVYAVKELECYTENGEKFQKVNQTYDRSCLSQKYANT